MGEEASKLVVGIFGFAELHKSFRDFMEIIYVNTTSDVYLAT
jgi:hypothetical protein